MSRTSSFTELSSSHGSSVLSASNAERLNCFGQTKGLSTARRHVCYYVIRDDTQIFDLNEDEASGEDSSHNSSSVGEDLTIPLDICQKQLLGIRRESSSFVHLEELKDIHEDHPLDISLDLRNT